MTAATLSVPARGDQLAVIGDFISEVAARAGFDERGVYQILTAVDEAVANIIFHAYDFEGQGWVHLNCEMRDRRLVVTITDHGNAFDPSAVPTPNVNAGLDERKEGGLGMFLMHKLMDEVRHEFRDNHNILTMVKRLA